jgi:hypothetical protein
LNISNMSQYTNLYMNNMLGSVASNASIQQNAVQDFQTSLQSSGTATSNSVASSDSDSITSTGHRHHHKAGSSDQDSSSTSTQAGSSASATNSLTSSNMLAQILGMNSGS